MLKRVGVTYLLINRTMLRSVLQYQVEITMGATIQSVGEFASKNAFFNSAEKMVFSKDSFDIDLPTDASASSTRVLFTNFKRLGVSYRDTIGRTRGGLSNKVAVPTDKLLTNPTSGSSKVPNQTVRTPKSLQIPGQKLSKRRLLQPQDCGLNCLTCEGVYCT
jgi:hypothetical protein